MVGGCVWADPSVCGVVFVFSVIRVVSPDELAVLCLAVVLVRGLEGCM